MGTLDQAFDVADDCTHGIGWHHATQTRLHVDQHPAGVSGCDGGLAHLLDHNKLLVNVLKIGFGDDATDCFELNQID